MYGLQLSDVSVNQTHLGPESKSPLYMHEDIGLKISQVGQLLGNLLNAKFYS